MLAAGTLLDGKYKILNRLGQGGMSTVYLAINEKANKTWAVKELRQDLGAQSALVQERLLAETELLKKLHHPSLPSIVDVLEERGTYYIVMDYVEGNSLETRLTEERPPSQEEVIDWGCQLCRVLGYLHSQEPPIVYRDMKPSNVMLRPDGSVALIDFGTAREFKSKEYQDDTVCLGTPGYAAPEQWGGSGQTDARTDIYCLGATLYHLVTGHHPMETAPEIRPIREWDARLSPGLEAILKTCMRREARLRYQTSEALLYALEHHWEEDQAYQRKQRRRLRVFLGTCLSLLLSLVAALFSFWKCEELRQETYQAFLTQALSEDTAEKQRECYARAVRLRPGQADAYLALLKNQFLQTEEHGTISFTKEEDYWLRSLLAQEQGDASYESILRENPEAYEKVAYELGLAYFYDYEGEGNKAYAVKWLQIAENSETLPQKCRERAKRLGIIAGYYTKIGQVNRAGDAFVSYLDYWKDLVALTREDLVELDNVVTALRMYQECLVQICTRAQDFLRAGVTQEELHRQLECIQQSLEEEFPAEELEAAGMTGRWKEQGELVRKARQQVAAAVSYAEKKKGEEVWSKQNDG